MTHKYPNKHQGLFLLGRLLGFFISAVSELVGGRKEEKRGRMMKGVHEKDKEGIERNLNR
jgi:hypothetical protein